MKAFAIITFLLFVCLVVLYFSKESGHEQAMKNKDKAYQIQLDSINKAWGDSLNHVNYRALLVFQEYVRKLDRANGESNHWKLKHDKEYSRNRAFTDSQQDSLLSRLN